MTEAEKLQGKTAVFDALIDLSYSGEEVGHLLKLLGSLRTFSAGQSIPLPIEQYETLVHLFYQQVPGSQISFQELFEQNLLETNRQVVLIEEGRLRGCQIYESV